MEVDDQKSRRLSIIFTGRDDDYSPDFKYRISTSINYITRTLTRTGRLSDVEILVTDWGSDAPLSRSLTLLPAASEICRFVYVPPSVIRRAQKGNESFPISLAPNIALRRARGEYLMVLNAGALIPEHSLEILLKLTEGKLHLPLAWDQTYFLLRLHGIPWRFVERQPDLEEWDRYLLLNPSVMRYENWPLLCLGEGAGGMMMHRHLWDKFRGFDEEMAGWGGNDYELAMRVTRHHPWADLSSFGVFVFKMAPSPLGRRPRLVLAALPEEKRFRISKTDAVNDEDWGLSGEELEIQRPQFAAAPMEGKSLLKTLSTGLPSRSSTEDVISELKGQKLQAWVKEIFSHLYKYRLKIKCQELDSLFFLAWHSLYRSPTVYLGLGDLSGYGAMTVGSICKDVEIYTLGDCGNGKVRSEPHGVARMLQRTSLGYCGHSRFVLGNLAGGIKRLQDSFIGKFSIDLGFVQEDVLGEDSSEQVQNLLSHLSDGGALVVNSSSEERFNLLWRETRARFPQFFYIRSSKVPTGIILAEKSERTVEKMTEEHKVHFNKSWAWPLSVKCQLIRIRNALMSPDRYREFSGRGYSRLKRWLRLQEKI